MVRGSVVFVSPVPEPYQLKTIVLIPPMVLVYLMILAAPCSSFLWLPCSLNLTGISVRGTKVGNAVYHSVSTTENGCGLAIFQTSREKKVGCFISGQTSCLCLITYSSGYTIRLIAKCHKNIQIFAKYIVFVKLQKSWTREAKNRGEIAHLNLEGWGGFIVGGDR
jgi:hypothetical protein